MEFKFHVERNILMRALGYSHSVVERKTTVPILSHILLQGEGQKLKITATDLEISIVELLEAQIEKEGAITVNEYTLHEIVRKLPDGSKITFEFEKTGSQMIVTSGASRFILSCLQAKEFPVIQNLKLPYHFKMPSKDLKRLFDLTKFAMSTEETRYYLNGIYIHPYQNQELRAVATDGHRLARVSTSLPEGAENFTGVIISRKTVNEVLRILSAQSSDIQIDLSETQINFTFENVFLTSRLIDGTFPDYEKAIPINNDKIMHIKMNSFLKAVERVSIISAEQSRGIKIGAEKNKLVLSAVSLEIGSAREEIEAEYEADPLEIGFNSRYLLDIAQQIENADTQFHFSDSNTAVIIKNVTDARSLYVLMPMRV